MNKRNEAIRMAREAGFAISDHTCDETVDKYCALIESVKTFERERCSAIVSAPHWKPVVRSELSKRAAAIRALKDGQ